MTASGRHQDVDAAVAAGQETQAPHCGERAGALGTLHGAQGGIGRQGGAA